MPRMAFMGVRISWLTLARDSSFAQVEGSGQGLVDADEAAGGVLEVNVVGKVVHERVEQVPFVYQPLLGLPAHLLGPPPLVGHEAAPGPVQRFAQAAEDRADQHEE